MDSDDEMNLAMRAVERLITLPDCSKDIALRVMHDLQNPPSSLQVWKAKYPDVSKNDVGRLGAAQLAELAYSLCHGNEDQVQRLITDA